MGLVPHVEAGMEVYAPGDVLIGVVDGVPGPRMQVAGKYMIPLSTIKWVEGNRIWLSTAALQYLQTFEDSPADSGAADWPAEQWETGEHSPGRTAP